jgi:hypothetical protein
VNNAFPPEGTATRVPDQSNTIFPGSPLAVVGVIMKSLQARFSGTNAYGSPYVWLPDIGAEVPAVPAGEVVPEKLLIESEFGTNPDAKGYAPSLYVQKGETQSLKLNMGETIAHDLPTGWKLKLMHASVPLQVDCVAHTPGESALLGDLVWIFFVACNEDLCAAWHFHDLTLPVLGRTTTYRPDPGGNERWVTTVGMVAQIKFMWTHAPIAPRLREIIAGLAVGDPAQALTLLATQGTSRR